MTQSGYPFVIKRLRRGQALDQAEEVFRGQASDVRTAPFVLRDPEGRAHATGAYRGLDFFNAEFVIFRPGGNVTLRIPRRASLSMEARSTGRAAEPGLGAGRAADVVKHRDHARQAACLDPRQRPRPRLRDGL
jgi:hypothetical protein